MRGDMPGVASFDDVARALEARGYQNTGELEGHGTFCVRGGAIDVYPGKPGLPGAPGLLRRRARRDPPHRALHRPDHRHAWRRGDLPGSGVPAGRGGHRARAQEASAPGGEQPGALREVLEKLEGGARFDGADVLLPYLYDEVASLPAYADPAVRAEDASADLPGACLRAPAGGTPQTRARGGRAGALLSRRPHPSWWSRARFSTMPCAPTTTLPRGRRARTSRSRGCTRPRRSWTSARGSA